MPAKPHSAASDTTHVMHNLAGIALTVMIVALGFAYLVDQMSKRPSGHAPALHDQDMVAQTVAGRELSIPRNWLRFGEQMQPGFVSQVDLSIQLALAADDASMRVDVTILPRSRARASSELLDSVYVHQFGSDTLSGVPGLVGKHLESDRRNLEETVWYDALASKPFVAKCMTPVDQAGSDKCIRTVQLPTGLAAIFSFDSGALPAWRSFDSEAAQWLERIGAL